MVISAPNHSFFGRHIRTLFLVSLHASPILVEASNYRGLTYSQPLKKPANVFCGPTQNFSGEAAADLLPLSGTEVSLSL